MTAALASLKKGERLVIEEEIGKKNRVRRITQFHNGINEEWGVHNNSVVNLARAVVERVFVVKIDGRYQSPPQPRKSVKKMLKTFSHKLLSHMGALQPITTKQFVDNYVGRKHKMYAKAVESLSETPIEPKDAYISAFIKDEKTNFRAKPNACPRIIQPRSPRFNVSVGVYLKPWEKALFPAIAAVFRGTTVAKGLNAEQRANLLRSKWEKFKDPVAVMLDAKRFDQHCNSQIIDWLHWMEERSFPELRRFNKMRKENVCYGRADDGTVKYTVKGRVMSGDMDTASGDTLIMCAMTWTIMEELGIAYEYINDGDDGVLIIESADKLRLRSRFHDAFLDYGFTMKWDGDTKNFEEIEFCQCQPVLTTQGWRMVRRPEVALAKDVMTLKRPRDGQHLKMLANSIGHSGRALAGDLPIFWKLYQNMIYDERDDIEFTSGMQFMSVGMNTDFTEPTAEVRLNFWRTFGILPEQQQHIENLICNGNYYDLDLAPVPLDFVSDRRIEVLISE